MERKLKENWFADLKVGDQVRIIAAKPGMDYPYAFVSDMQEQKDKIFTIEEIIEEKWVCADNGDKRRYLFKQCGYNWHSLMFEPVDDRFYEQLFSPEFKIVL